MHDSMTSLQKGIERRQQELHTAAAAISRSSTRCTLISNMLKVLTILLGAITAAKGTFDTIAGSGNATASLVTFTIIGIAIAVSGGVEAAFKFEKRGVALTELAATCQAKVRWVDTEWRSHIGSKAGTDQSDAARRIIGSADEKLAQVQLDAAKLGLNITAQFYHRDEQEYRAAVSA